MSDDIENKEQKAQRKIKRQKGAIAGLTVGLLLAIGGGVAAPLIILKNKGDDKPTPGPTEETVQLTFSAGDGTIGKFEDGSISIVKEIKKGSSLAEAVENQPKIVIQDTYKNEKCFACWLDSQGNVFDPSLPINENITLTASYSTLDNHATVSFSVNAAEGEKLLGTDLIRINKNTTWSEISENLKPISTKEGAYTFKGWTTTKGTKTPISDDYPITSNIVLYPVWEDVVTYMAKFTYQLTEEESIVFGSKEVEVDLGSSVATKPWSEIPRPTIRHRVGTTDYLFSHFEYYNGTDWIEITNTTQFGVGTYDVKPVFIAPVNAITISFTDAKGEGNLTWVGNTAITIPGGSVAWTDVQKPGVYKDTGTSEWDPSFTSKYYFDEWLDVSTDQPISGTIDHNINVYPTFKQKTELTFNFKDSTQTQKTLKSYAAPTEGWSSVSKPEFSLDETAGYFAGWQTKFKDGTNRALLPEDEVNDIDVTYADGITPKYLAKDLCHKLVFSTDGYTESFDEEGEPVYTKVEAGETNNWKYKSNNEMGILKSEDTLLDSIAKPEIMSINPKGDTRYTFVKWQIQNSEDQWVDLQSGTKISASTESKTYNFRPILEKQLVITFDPNTADGGKFVTSGQDKVHIAAKSVFSQIYKPDVVNESADKKFKSWYYLDKDGNKVYVNHNTVLTKDTTLTAEWTDASNNVVVNFALTQKDKDEGAQLFGDTVAKQQKDVAITFGDITRGYATKPMHIFKYWCTDPEKPAETEVKDDQVLFAGGEGLTVYAVFEKDQSYNKATIIDDPEGKYEIISGKEQYFAKNSAFKKYLTYEINQVGYEADRDKWYYRTATSNDDWKLLTDDVTITGDIELKPTMVASTRTVKFWNMDDEDIKMPTNQQIELPYRAKISDYVNKETFKATYGDDEFKGWQIYDEATKTTVAIDDDAIITKDIIVVPKFIGKSDFKNSNLAYFYDEDAGQWAGITNYTNNDLDIIYSDGVTTGKKNKFDFNYEVLFGTRMTEIPDDFMAGCVNWTNGKDKAPLEIGINVKKIGKRFCIGCVSFDNTIDFSKCESTKLEIGENFLANCYAFNHDLDLSNFGFVLVTGAGCFMSECQNFTSKLIIDDVPDNSVLWFGKDDFNCSHIADEYSLSSTNYYSNIHLKGFSLSVHTQSSGVYDIDTLTSTDPFGRATFRKVNR